ncbi:heavy metal translocating P-type ATPase [Erysipelothrix urinaevulpis]|uniref:heavy metal translocating P-type ATPase n=1 Tax=Erysipelothrix urinaevulpis TaxID=2683717 RepID=UPI0013577A34|nr:cation-translocating P-type ATPase [Erysipelothrix urinaevulpis]
MTKMMMKHGDYFMYINGTMVILSFVLSIVLKESRLTEIALLIAGLIGVLPVFYKAISAIKLKIVSIELLVSIAVFGAFYIKNYEEAAIVTFLFLFGSYLEQKTIKKTRNSIKDLVSMMPDVALRKINHDEFEEIDLDEININDILLIKTGMKIPVDGHVISGEGYVSEANITGEPYPRWVEQNEQIYAGTMLDNGTLQMLATKVGEDTVFGKIIELVEDAQDRKSKLERFIDQFSRYYTPLILLLSLIYYLLSRDIETTITILVLGCPGALVIGVPISNVSGIGNGASHGVLLKGSEIIQTFSKTSVIAFDKTGTLTTGRPQVHNVFNYSNEYVEILDYVGSIEQESNHPIAKAILDYIGEFNSLKVSNTSVHKGLGIEANVKKLRILVGNTALMEQENVEWSAEVEKDIKESEAKGFSIACVAVHSKIQMVFIVQDALKKNIADEIKQLKKLGIDRFVILSGDNSDSVQIIANELEIKEAYGGLMPEDKAKFINNLQEKGEVVTFIGDGINDSPSIVSADIGIAVGNGTDVAIETSDIVLLDENISFAYGLSKATRNNMIQNIVISIIVVLFLVINLFVSDWMNMSIGMLLHEGSILLVILNAIRLKKYRL